jgi:hypothetical protein
MYLHSDNSFCFHCNLVIEVEKQSITNDDIWAGFKLRFCTNTFLCVCDTVPLDQPFRQKWRRWGWVGERKAFSAIVDNHTIMVLSQMSRRSLSVCCRVQTVKYPVHKRPVFLLSACYQYSPFLFSNANNGLHEKPEHLGWDPTHPSRLGFRTRAKRSVTRGETLEHRRLSDLDGFHQERLKRPRKLKWVWMWLGR